MNNEQMKTGDKKFDWLKQEVTDYLSRISIDENSAPDVIREAVHNSFFPLFREGKYQNPAAFQKDYLEAMKRALSLSENLRHIALSASQQILESGLFNYGRVTLSELHLTDLCNLSCSWCTYRTLEQQKSIEFDKLKHIVELSPLEILICGGGEPTLYKNGDHDFNSVISYLRDNLPGTRLRLITNGSIVPAGNWLNLVDEVSVSLDEHERALYQKNKGKDLFQKVWQNIQFYLFKSPVSLVRITKVFNRENLFDGFGLAEKAYELWNRIPVDSPKKSRFKCLMLPLAWDQDQMDPYAPSHLSLDDRQAWQRELESLQTRLPDYYDFLKSNTNFLDLADKEYIAPSAQRCWPASQYLLFAADQKIYPCFAACSNFKASAVGSLGMPVSEITARRESLLARAPRQCAQGCRPASVYYGLQSKNYYYDQNNLKLPALKEMIFDQLQVVHVSYQDPSRKIGGIGWVVTSLCQEQINKERIVYWISPCIKGEDPGEFLYEGGLLRVIKLKFADEVPCSLFADTDESQKLRKKFSTAAVSYIKQEFSPEDCAVHLHGFIEIPRRSKELRQLGYQVISTYHMLLSERNKSIGETPELISKQRELERLSFDANSIITVPTNGMADQIRDIHPSYSGAIHCVPNGIGRIHFDTPFKEAQDLDNLVLSFGRISPEKGYELLIEAARILEHEWNNPLSKDLKFSIFGNTDLRLESKRLYVESLQKLCERSSNIKLLASNTGVVGVEKIRLIDSARVVVIPSLYEPFGLVIPEAMARGKPIVTTMTTGGRYIMESNETGPNDFGYLVEPDSEAMAQALKWLFEHPAELKQMGQNAFKRSKDFDWKGLTGRLDQLYRAETGDKTAPHPCDN